MLLTCHWADEEELAPVPKRVSTCTQHSYFQYQGYFGDCLNIMH